MSKHTTFRIGGPARWFVEVKNAEELKEAIGFAKSQGVPWFVLGGGTNTLVSDKGFDGVVINMANREVTVNGQRSTVYAGAGAISVVVARKAADAGLTGMEWAASLPGTIGGAVRGNAGCFGGEMKDVVESAQVLRCSGNGQSTCALEHLSTADLNFSYRDSAIKHSRDIVIDATLKLAIGDKQAIKSKMNDVLSRRKTTQPTAAGTAGCAFKNPLVDGQLISAGKIIERLGLKGTKIGGIRISDEHGNFLINDGTATADQVIQLINLIKVKARDELGIQMAEEVQYVGYGNQ